MSDEPFSLADAEALFGPENWEHLGQLVADAPEFTPEQRERIRAAFAAGRAPEAKPAADAA